MINKCFACDGGNVNEKIQEVIKEFGLGVISVHNVIDGYDVPMTYSIGITETLDKPEMIVFGLPAEHAKVFINTYFIELKNGAVFEDNVDYDMFADGFPARFKTISDESYIDNMDQSVAYNVDRGLNLKAVQFIFPDAEKRWPWEDDVDPGFKIVSNILE